MLAAARSTGMGRMVRPRNTWTRIQRANRPRTTQTTRVSKASSRKWPRPIRCCCRLLRAQSVLSVAHVQCCPCCPWPTSSVVRVVRGPCPVLSVLSVAHVQCCPCCPWPMWSDVVRGSLGQRIGSQLELHDFARRALAAFHVERRARADRRPESLALPAGLRHRRCGRPSTSCRTRSDTARGARPTCRPSTPAVLRTRCRC